MRSRVYTPDDIDRLAALSRRYHKAIPDIVSAVVQELRADPSPGHRLRIAELFGLSTLEIARFDHEHVKALYHGYMHRAGLYSPAAVYARVLREIESGELQSGSQFPARTVFTVRYYCNKKTHGEVVERLLKSGVVHRPGGDGGPLFVL